MSIEYMVVNGGDMEARVQRLLNEGWELQGGVAVYPTYIAEERDVSVAYAQALVRRTSE